MMIKLISTPVADLAVIAINMNIFLAGSTINEQFFVSLCLLEVIC